MTAEDRIAVARASYEAYVRKDRVAIEGLLAKDFHFTSPLDNRLDRATYLAHCWPHSADFEDIKFSNLVAQGDRVFVTYEARMRGGKRFRNTEVVTVRDRKVQEVEVYFGWSIPHPALEGGFVAQGSEGK